VPINLPCVTSGSAVAVILASHTHEYLHNQANSQNCEAQLLASSCLCLSFHMKQLCSIRRIFMRFDIWVFFKNLWRKLKFHSNLMRITSSLREDLCTFLIISHWICHTMRSISDKWCRENQNTHFVLINFSHQKMVHFLRRCREIC